jgi:hypothetical protein
MEKNRMNWGDAFRAGGYDPQHTARNVAKIKSKIAQGLELTSGGRRRSGLSAAGEDVEV